MYLGSFGIDDYVGIPAATHRFSSGAAYAPTVLTYSIYEEATDVGIDENVDMVVASPFDAVVGCYWIRRQLTAAAGFEAGKNYLVVVKATVDGVAAIQMHTFQVEARVRSNTVAILGTALTETVPGYISLAFKKVFDVLNATWTALSINQTGDSFARIGALGAGLTAVPSFGDFSAAQKTTIANYTGYSMGAVWFDTPGEALKIGEEIVEGVQDV
jgi:hypothetical protein